jgi:hypothetical protein
MSASFVRNIVKNGRKDIFIELYEKYLDYDKINHLYDIIYGGLQKPNKKIQSKSITTTYEPKYIYPITRETFINMEKNTKKTRKSYDLPKTKKMRKGGKKKQTKQTKRKK